MAFAADIVLDDASGDDITYRLTGQEANGSKRIDIATTLSAPAFLAIRHSQAGKGSDTVDRHLVQFTRTLIDANGVPRTLTVNLTLAVPRSAVITSQVVIDQVSNLLDLLMSGGFTTLASTANIDSLLRNEA
jgi:hypothetical protein